MGVLIFSVAACSPDLRLPVSTEKSITVVLGDTVHQIQVLPHTEKVSVLPVRFYHYFSGGQLGKAEGAYLGKVLHGPYQQHTRQKQLLEQGMFDKGLKVGIWKQWHAAGHLAAQKEYKKGFLHGKWLSYSSKGSLIWSKSYKENLPNGRCTSYFPNSQAQLEETWKEGVRHGEFKEYYAGGALKRKGQYRNNELHGTLREYSETGTVLKERYTNGELRPRRVSPAADTIEVGKGRLRKLFRFRKRSQESEAIPAGPQPILQEQDKKNQEEQKRVRWWPFRFKKKQDTSESSQSNENL